MYPCLLSYFYSFLLFYSFFSSYLSTHFTPPPNNISSSLGLLSLSSYFLVIPLDSTHSPAVPFNTSILPTFHHYSEMHTRLMTDTCLPVLGKSHLIPWSIKDRLDRNTKQRTTLQIPSTPHYSKHESNLFIMSTQRGRIAPQHSSYPDPWTRPNWPQWKSLRRPGPWCGKSTETASSWSGVLGSLTFFLPLFIFFFLDVGIVPASVFPVFFLVAFCPLLFNSVQADKTRDRNAT